MSTYIFAASFLTEVMYWLRGNGLHIAIIIVGAWILRKILTRIIATILRRALHIEQSFVSDLDREKRMETFIVLINAILSVLVWIVAGMLVLQELGIQPGPLMTGAGVLGVGLAFGTQALVKDFVSGLFIVLENQYRVGDDVELDSTKGVVEHVGIRTTVLRDEDGNIHFVPNGLIQRTTNKSLGFSTLLMSLTTESEVNQETIVNLINQVAQKLAKEKKWASHFIEPLDYHEMGKTTDMGIEFIVKGKVKTTYRKDISAEFHKRLLERLEQKHVKVIKLVEIIPPKPEKESKSKK